MARPIQRLSSSVALSVQIDGTVYIYTKQTATGVSKGRRKPNVDAKAKPVLRAT